MFLRTASVGMPVILAVFVSVVSVSLPAAVAMVHNCLHVNSLLD